MEAVVDQVRGEDGGDAEVSDVGCANGRKLRASDCAAALVNEPLGGEVREVEEGCGDGNVNSTSFLHWIAQVQGNMGLESGLLLAEAQPVGVSVKGSDKVVKGIAFSGIHGWEGDNEGANGIVAGTKGDVFPGGCHRISYCYFKESLTSTDTTKPKHAFKILWDAWSTALLCRQWAICR